MTKHDDFARPIMIHVCKDGTISFRDKSKREKVFNGVALPVFSVDTVEQAEAVQVRFGRHQYTEHPQMPGKPWYRWTNFGGQLEDLDRVSTDIRDFYNRHLKGAKP